MYQTLFCPETYQKLEITDKIYNICITLQEIDSYRQALV
jgi:hypothetical protein